MSYSLRQYQADANAAVMTYYRAGNKGNCLVALPTGTGKSLTIAGFICDVFRQWPGQRIIVCAHTAELLTQNSNTLQKLWPSAPFGIYSAELKRKETIYPITFAGIGSIVKAADAFGRVNVLIIDEAQLVSDVDSSQYRRFISALKLVNPNLIVIGFTATPYRMKVGLLTDGTLFDDIVFDLTDLDSFNSLVAAGYLSPLIARKTQAEYDISEVGLTAGEYNQKQLARAVDKFETTKAACQELIQAAQDRHCGIIFADSIAHAETIAHILQAEGETAAVVHSKLTSKQNEAALDAHKRGDVKWLVNKDKLTTGYDWPPLDICGMLRHTRSPGLWVQMLGRLTRPYDFLNPQPGHYKPGFDYTKVNALVLDFAKNSNTLGPINDPKLPKKKGKGTGDMPIKICDAITAHGECGCYNHPSKRVCDDCGAPFEFKVKIAEVSSKADVMKADPGVVPVVQWFDVRNAHYDKIRARGGTSPAMMIAKYHCPQYHDTFNQIICIEHPDGSYPRKQAVEWWQKRFNVVSDLVPTTVDQALRLNAGIRMPSRVRVHLNSPGRPKIISEEF